jgi:ABC-type lipoprotein release transport system permease subunit
MGLEPVSFCKATGFGRSLFYNRDKCEDAFVPSYIPDRSGCIVGVDVQRFSGRDHEGNYYHSEKPMQIALIISCFPLTASGRLAKLGTDIVNRKTFYFSDDSHSGIAKVDGKTIYIPFDVAQMLCGMDGSNKRASAIHIKFADGVSLDDGCESVKRSWQGFVEKHKDQKLANLFENVKVQSWIDHRRHAIAPMEKEQTMLILLFLMLGVITVFVIFVVFYMIISHKSKDIGILKTVGIGVGSIIELFLRFAVIVGFVGAATGAALGCLFLSKINVMEDWLFERFGWQLWNRSIYAIGDIPDKVEWQVITVIVISAVTASVIGALLPSIQAAIRQPAKILQVDQL